MCFSKDCVIDLINIFPECIFLVLFKFYIMKRRQKRTCIAIKITSLYFVAR